MGDILLGSDCSHGAMAAGKLTGVLPLAVCRLPFLSNPLRRSAPRASSPGLLSAVYVDRAYRSESIVEDSNLRIDLFSPVLPTRRRVAGVVSWFPHSRRCAWAGQGQSFRGSSTTVAMGQVEAMDPLQQRLMFEDECILVDEKDNVVGHDSKYNCHLMEKIESENLLHRAFSVFLFNSKNELLLQKRSGTKVTFPLVWTNTCCSHPLYRDSELIEDKHLGVRNAAQRKLFDELGIVAEDAPVDAFTCLGRILYKAPSDGKWGEHELDYLVFLHRDVKVQPNPEEVSDIQYVNREQLQELVKKADAKEDSVKLSPWFRIVVDNFLYDWWERVENGSLADAADMSTIHKL